MKDFLINAVIAGFCIYLSEYYITYPDGITLVSSLTKILVGLLGVTIVRLLLLSLCGSYKGVSNKTIDNNKL